MMVPLEAERLANTVAYLLRHPRVAQRIAANGFETISSWTWDDIARKKIAIISKSVCVSSAQL
jgi:spore maturation protein CgeB